MVCTVPDLFYGREQQDINDIYLQFEKSLDYSYNIKAIAPYMTKVSQHFPHMSKWRKQLKTGDKCDVVDPSHKWYTCTIVDIAPTRNQIMVHFTGWLPKYDEWISRDSPRLQPAFTVAKGGKDSGGVNGEWKDLEPIIEDLDDPHDENIYAIWRVKCLYMYIMHAALTILIYWCMHGYFFNGSG